MKKQLLLTIVLLVFCSVMAWCTNGDLLRGKTKEGVEMTFTVTDEANKCCSAGYLKEDGTTDLAVSWVAEGTITIPSSVKGYTVSGISKNAFYQCSKISQVIIPATVTSIAREAFFGCSNLASITIPDNVVSIGRYAFQGTKWLKNQSGSVYAGKVYYLCKGGSYIDIKDGTIGIAGEAFWNVSTLVSVTIPSSVRHIEEHAFWFCKNLKYLDIPKSVTYIHENAVRGCNGLEGIHVDSENEFYDSRDNCNALIETSTNKLLVGCQSTAIPSSVTSIRNYAFEDCESLLGMLIPDGVKSIGEGAFNDCSKLKSIILPSEITEIKSSTFSGCSSLASITIPNSVTSIEANAFYNCSFLKTVNLPNSLESIGRYAFSGCTGISRIIFPEGMQSIGGCAFKDCNNLSFVSIPSSITSVGEQAFAGTKWYENLPDGVLYFGNVAYCYKGTMPESCSITLKDGTTSIADRAFLDQTSLISIVLPNSLKTIGSNSFQGCTGLTSLVFPDQLEQICQVAFSGCSGLQSISLPDGITTIPYSTFSDCTNLSNVTLPRNLNSIQSSAFRGCTSLSSIEIPSGVSAIEGSAFNGCGNLSSINIPSSVVRIGTYAFYGTKWLDNQPDGVIYLGNNVYQYKGNMEENMVVHIKEGTISISPWAFNDWNLSTVYIPESVRFIYDYAFVNCSNLKTVYVKGKTPPEIETANTFQYRMENATLYVPSGTKTNYENAKYWKEFSSIVEMSYPIEFADANVKTLCVANWDADGDGELSEDEAAAVTDLGDVFSFKKTITSFNELSYFTNLTSIGEKAFNNCSNLTAITLPDNITTIGKMAFLNCKGLTSLSIPNSVLSIELDAFAFCENIHAIHISDLAAWCNIQFVSNNVFNDYHLYLNGTEINELIIPESITSIRFGAFSGCISLTSLVVPRNVSSIEGYAFSGCSVLSSISFGDNVATIGRCALQGCSSLTSVTIPQSVSYIDQHVFYLCTCLEEVHVENRIPCSISQWAFDNSANMRLYVPAGCKAAYEAADYWKEFKEIVEMEDESSNSTLFAVNEEALAGSNTMFPIKLNNEDEVKLCQFDLRLPDGITVATKADGKLDVKLTERAENHSVSSQQLSNGDYRFVISSMDNDSFVGNEGTLMEITLDVPAAMVAGEYTVKVLNVELSVPDGNDLVVVRPADTESKLTVKSYTPGDVNNDGSVSVTDVGCAINYILEQVPSVFVFEAADMNGDKSVSVTDVGMIINLILSDGAASRERNDMERNKNNENNFLPDMSLLPTTDGYELLLEDKGEFIGFQFDVELEEGATISGVRLNEGDESDHLVACCLLQSSEASPTTLQSLEASPTTAQRSEALPTTGKWRVVCYSPTNSVFTNDNAPLLTINVVGEASKLCVSATVSNLRLTTAGFDELRPADLNSTTTGISSVKQNMKFIVEGGTLRITSDRDETLQIYSLDGRVSRKLQVKKGQNSFDGLHKGIYMINNQKVIVR